MPPPQVVFPLSGYAPPLRYAFYLFGIYAVFMLCLVMAEAGALESLWKLGWGTTDAGVQAVVREALEVRRGEIQQQRHAAEAAERKSRSVSRIERVRSESSAAGALARRAERRQRRLHRQRHWQHRPPPVASVELEARALPLAGTHVLPGSRSGSRGV